MTKIQNILKKAKNDNLGALGGVSSVQNCSVGSLPHNRAAENLAEIIRIKIALIFGREQGSVILVYSRE